jgi:hypothetical protein
MFGRYCYFILSSFAAVLIEMLRGVGLYFVTKPPTTQKDEELSYSAAGV